MKAPITAIGSFLTLIVTVAFSAPEIYFGEDLNTSLPPGTTPDTPTRLEGYPNATREAARFQSRLVGVTSESFESFADGASPTSIAFGDTTATLSGSREVRDVPTGTFAGVYPTNGDRTLLLLALSSGFFRLDFSDPQAAFGFYATDLESATLSISLIRDGGPSSSIEVPSTVGQGSGGVLFFGVIDEDAPFVALEFSRVGPAEDGFGFDDFTIGPVDAVVPEPPTTSIAMYAGITITGTLGAEYLIEYSTTLEPISWLPLETITLPESPYIYFDKDSAMQPRRFYRALVAP